MIKCIAIDDEPLALQQIARFVERIPDLHLVGKYYNADDAREAIIAENVDVIFLDIEMPECNGMDFARQLGDKCPYIIFTTAYSQYAVEGFRLDAVDYLLKPLSFEEMCQAVEKLKRRKSAVIGTEKPEIFVKSSGNVRKLLIEDILYIKGLAEYVQIFLRGEASPITIFDSIKRFESELLSYSFMRVHKSYLINLNAVETANRQSAIIDGEIIPIGEKYRSDFSNYLKSKITNQENHHK